MEGPAGGQGNKYGGVGVVGCSGGKWVIWPGPPALSRACLCGAQAAWVPHCRVWKDSSSSSGHRQVGEVGVMLTLRARLKAGDGGMGVKKPKEWGSLASVAEVVPAGGESRPTPVLFRAAAAARDLAQRLALPLPKLEEALSPPTIRMGRASFRPWIPDAGPPPPTASTLQLRGAGGGRRARSSGRG